MSHYENQSGRFLGQQHLREDKIEGLLDKLGDIYQLRKERQSQIGTQIRIKETELTENNTMADHQTIMQYCFIAVVALQLQLLELCSC